MAEADFTQDADTSLFKLKSHGWRKVDIGVDNAIEALENAYQNSYAIEGLMTLLQEKALERSREGEPDISRLEDQLMIAISRLNIGTNRTIESFAYRLQERVNAKEKQVQ